MRLRPSPTGVIAILALVLALGGTAVAASRYVITKSSQIKPSVLKELKGKQGPKGSPGSQGPRGLAGPQGAAGPAGPTTLSKITAFYGPNNSIPAEGVQTSIAYCPFGSRAVSGGGSTSNPYGMAISQMGVDHGSWGVVTANPTSLTTEKVQAVVYCTVSGQAVASSAGSHPRVERQMRALAVALGRNLSP